MARFNLFKSKEPPVLNHMGAPAFAQTPELELVSMLLTSFADDSYYRSGAEGLSRLRELLSRCDPEFSAKAAIYARTVFGMRSISHALAAELASAASGKVWARKFYEKIVARPDDMTEIMACFIGAKGRKLPNALRKGFAAAFGKFDAYQLAKYRGEGREVSLVDVVNLVRPKPVERNGQALHDLVNGTLRATDTWESKLSKAGQVATDETEKAALKRDTWVELVRSRRIGYFALLRNLRNILEQAPEVVPEAVGLLVDPRLLRNSLVLPFRFIAAYAEVEAMKEGKFESERGRIDAVLAGLEKAVRLSVDNLPTLRGRTLILSDNSGSMTGDGGGHSLVSKMSRVRTADIANLFAVLYWLKAEDTLVGLFGERLVFPKLDRSKGVFDNFRLIDTEKNACGPGTEAGIFDIFRKMIREKTIVDTAVVFSDTQIGERNAWYGQSDKSGSFDALFQEYRRINPHFRCYSVDLRGYGTTVFDGSVIKVAGWSEKIFEVMKFAEQDPAALLRQIEKVELN